MVQILQRFAKKKGGMISINPELFHVPNSEIVKFGNDNLIYGSLAPKGLRRMVDTINKIIHDRVCIGLDLGCGDGELIYHLQSMMPGSAWSGVEISEHRVSLQKRDVAIWQGDMLEEDLRSYTVLHADNLCLVDSVAEALEKKIAREFSGLYISYRTARFVEFLRVSQLVMTVMTETTWSKHPIHFYLVNELF